MRNRHICLAIALSLIASEARAQGVMPVEEVTQPLPLDLPPRRAISGMQVPVGHGNPGAYPGMAAQQQNHAAQLLAPAVKTEPDSEPPPPAGESAVTTQPQPEAAPAATMAPPPAPQGGGTERPPIELPAVPAALVEKPKFDLAPGGQAPGGSRDMLATTAAEVVVKPGTNEIVTVAVGHLNRIVTPFAKPKVETASRAEIRVSQNVIYVQPTDKQIITLFITSETDEGLAASLTLKPMEIPPRELTLKFPDHVGMVQSAHKAADKADHAKGQSTYVNEIAEAMKAIAMGEFPMGYSFRAAKPGDQPPGCAAPPGVTVAPGQMFVGRSREIMVGVVANHGAAPLELDEKWCVIEGTLAVAYWPHVLLHPGQKTEVYVMRQPLRDVVKRTQRPSLVGE